MKNGHFCQRVDPSPGIGAAKCIVTVMISNTQAQHGARLSAYRRISSSFFCCLVRRNSHSQK